MKLRCLVSPHQRRHHHPPVDHHRVTLEAYEHDVSRLHARCVERLQHLPQVRHPPRSSPTPLSTEPTTSENNIDKNHLAVPAVNKAARSLVPGPPSSQAIRGSTSTSMSSDHRPHSCDHPPKHVPATRATSPATSAQRPNINNAIEKHVAFVAANKAARPLVLGLQREQRTRGLAGSSMNENSDDIICDPFLERNKRSSHIAAE